MNNAYNKESKIIIIPDGTKQINDEAFIDFTNLEEIIIPDSVEHIGKGAFKGCSSLKKVRLSNNLHLLEDFAFSECENLEEIDIPKSLHYYSYGVFSHCHNLKKINAHNEIDFIDDLAFFDCKSLTDFHISNNTTSIGKMALYGCESIKEIHIPKNVELIEYGALSLMSSLEKITVDEENEKYFTEDDDTVLLSKDGMIIQYAINCDRDEFIVGYYVESFGNTVDENGNAIPLESYEIIYNISDYAFAGAKKLKKLYLASEVEGIGGKSFLGCDNLKNLEIFHSSYGDSLSLHIYKRFNEEAEIPFENITIDDGIKTLCGKLSDLFKNARTITLPSTLEHIGEDIFLKSKYLKYLKIPENIKMISPNTFNPGMKLEFPTFGALNSNSFNMLQTKTSEDYYISHHDRGNIRIFSLKDGTYYVKIDDYDIVKVNKDEIINLSNSSNIMADKPDDFIMYIIHLLSINVESSRILTSIWTDPKLEELFNKFVNDCDYVKEIAEKKTSRTIREILDHSGIYDEFLFTGMIRRKISKEEMVKVISNYNDSINRFFRLSPIDTDDDVVINVDSLIRYCNLLEKYQRYDKFLYNPVFINRLSYQNQELLIKYFNKNIKRLLISSKTLDDKYGENLNDLLKLCNSLGIFCNEERLSQRMSTFLNEKVFNEEDSTHVLGNDIHSMFGEIKPRDEVDYEFVLFFVENYEKLVELEQQRSGIIARIYNAFRDISKTSTSHRGSQRHLKVTIDKCLDYFLAERFEGITEENKDLAQLLQKYYSESYALSIGEMITKQSQDAPRNIFTKIVYDENEDPIYSYDSNEDLVEHNIDDFSYEWLPKQDYDNLILGKYCSCCAHLLGAGAGIMRASMILNNCQNLVIRNTNNEIIAKMTIYVNKKEGYAVFNTTEINTIYRDADSLDKIYKAFLRGTKAFVERYNANNDIPITIVSIGEYRNILKEHLGNIETKLLSTPNYSCYGYYAGDKSVGTYDGDCKNKQILVLKK